MYIRRYIEFFDIIRADNLAAVRSGHERAVHNNAIRYIRAAGYPGSPADNAGGKPSDRHGRSAYKAVANNAGYSSCENDGTCG